MEADRTGWTAVIFVSTLGGADPDGYARAAAEMDRLAAAQPGFRGVEAVRDAAGAGITVSYWRDDAAAKAWRDHPDHRRIREAGRALWYRDYTLTVASVTRNYGWSAP